MGTADLPRGDERRPVVGVTTWRRPLDAALGAGWPCHTIGVEYVDALARHGASVVLLPPGPDPAALLDRLDGLVLSGGEDVDPASWSPSDPAAARSAAKDVDPIRDAFEIELARAARARRLPVLAICRGMQLANIAFGGTLVPDLPETAAHERPRPGAGAGAQLAARHAVRLDPASRLARLRPAGPGGDRVNTIHHQAVHETGEGLHAVAWAADGVIEALEARDAGWPLWAVQWHPEKAGMPASAASDEEARREAPLFDDFIAACRSRAARSLAAPRPDDPSAPIPEEHDR